MSNSLSVIFFRVQLGDDTVTKIRRMPNCFVTSNVRSVRVSDGAGPPPSGAVSNSIGAVYT